MMANNFRQRGRIKFILFMPLIIIFLLPNCASSPGPAIRRVGISEPPSKGKGWHWDESKRALVYREKEERGEGKEEPKLPGAVKEVTPPPAAEKSFIKMEVETLSRKDFIRSRFPGKKVYFPEEIRLLERKPEYRVGPDDVLQVLVWNQPDLSMEVLVRKDGSISMPLLGNVKVEGLTIPEIEEILRQGFAPYVEKPHIIVNPKEINSLRISIVGRIKKPDISIGPVRPGFILRGGNTLLEILSDVEIYPDADLSASYVARGESIIPVDLKALLKDGDLSQNILLEPGDKVVVPGPMKEVTILGEVRAPDRYRVNLDTTLLDALSIAKGINKDSADLYMAYVARHRKILPVNLKRLLDFGDMNQNMILEDGDIVYIPNINEKKFYVLGEVAKPGVIYFTDPMDIVEALAQAGGFLSTARRSQVVVVRGDIRQPQIYEINLLSLMEGKSLERFTLQKGDIVYIPRTAIADWNVFLSQILPTLQAVDIIDVIRSRH
ncbi:MAG: polysaccharide biosynthesis/export family protein [Thermodesulfobacteriota bacterium]